MCVYGQNNLYIFVKKDVKNCPNIFKKKKRISNELKGKDIETIYVKIKTCMIEIQRMIRINSN